MNKVYVLYSEEWSGGGCYHAEIICVYKDEEVAYRTALSYQQCHKPCDVHYDVKEVEFEGLVP